MRGLATERRESIAELLRSTGFIRNSELSGRFGVSVVTIRQDVDSLCAKGLAHKTYGGAVLHLDDAPIGDSPFDQRSGEHAPQKRRIGAAAAAMIKPGEIVLLDAGTTCLEIARQIPEDLDITIVTCALNNALEASKKQGVRVVVCGGTLNPRTLSVNGYQVERDLDGIWADRLFLATYGVDLEKGLKDRSIEGAQTKRTLIGAAKEVILVCDSSKFGEEGQVLVSGMQCINRVVTDSGIPPLYANWFRSNGVPVLAV